MQSMPTRVCAILASWPAPAGRALPCPLLRASRQRGLTLIELMVVLAIFSLLSMLAAPSFFAAQERYRVAMTLEAIGGAMTLARTEAIRRGGNVRLERITGGDCPALAGVQHWSCGWRIVAEAVAADAQDADSTLVREFRIGRGVVVTFSTAAPSVVFNRWGQPGNLGTIGFDVVPESNPGSPAAGGLCLLSTGRQRPKLGGGPC